MVEGEGDGEEFREAFDIFVCKGSFIVLILDGNSEHDAHASRKIGLV